MAERPKPAEALLHRGLGHIEFFDLAPAQLEDLQPLLDAFAREGRNSFSFHAPAARPEEFPYAGVTCFFLCEDESRRELSFRLLRRTMAAARRWGASYVVTHLTFGPSDTRNPRAALLLARGACRRMAEMSAEAGIHLDVEFAAYSDAFHSADLFAETVGRHAELGICIDIGHTFLGALSRGRDDLADIAALAPRARSMHLWNTTGPEHTRLNHHTPLHPSQRTQDGWLDVERIVETVVDENPRVSLVFEYPVEEVTAEVQEGYDWIANIVERLKRRNSS